MKSLMSCGGGARPSRRQTTGPASIRGSRSGAWAIFAIAVLAIPPLLGACAAKAKEESRRPRAVSVLTITPRNFALEAEYAARILPASQVSIIPKVGGRVEEVLVRVGDFVRTGDTLLTIEATDLGAQYRQAQAALQSAQASLTRSQGTGQESQVLQSQSAYDQALAARDEIQKAWEKTKKLFEGGAVSRQAMDEADARLKAAKLQLDTAQKNLALVRDKSGAQASDVISGQVDAAQAQADLARSQLDSTKVRSPLTGHVSYRDVEPGALVGSSSLTFVVMDDSQVLAEAGLSDRSIGGIVKGMEVAVSVGALGPQWLLGKVDWVGPSADPRSLLYPVRVRLDNPQGKIRPGMLARIRLPVERPHEAILVPERSLFTESGIDYVMVAEGAVARRRQVDLGQSDGKDVVVLSGLKAGERIVIAGQEFLSEGDPINARE